MILNVNFYLRVDPITGNVGFGEVTGGEISEPKEPPKTKLEVRAYDPSPVGGGQAVFTIGPNSSGTLTIDPAVFDPKNYSVVKGGNTDGVVKFFDSGKIQSMTPPENCLIINSGPLVANLSVGEDPSKFIAQTLPEQIGIGAFPKYKAHIYLDYVLMALPGADPDKTQDIGVEYLGVTKEFTLKEFLERLGFEEEK